MAPDVTVAASAVIGDLLAEGRPFRPPAVEDITEEEAEAATGEGAQASASP
jgi:hypothetical protein